MRIKLSKPARTDLRDIWLYYFEESGQAEIAKQVVRSILESTFVLETFPRAGRVRGKDALGSIRALVSGRYLIFYREKEDSIFITRILHASRDVDGILFSL